MTSQTGISGVRPSRRSGDGLALGAILLLACALRLLPAAFLPADSFDMRNYRLMAEVALRFGNIYQEAPGVYPYTPLSLPLPAAAHLLASALQWPFSFTMKLPTIVAELCIVALLYRVGIAGRGGSPRRGMAFALAYAVNPVAILISGFHGNVMPIASLLCLAAYHAIERSGAAVPPARDRYLGALLLGLGVAFRGFPVLLAPVFALRLRRTNWPAFLAVAALPSALLLAPFLVASPADVVREILTYSGRLDFGVGAMLKLVGVAPMRPLETNVATETTVQMSKLALLASYGLLLLLLWRRPDPAPLAFAVAATWLLFYSVYAGVAAHYFVWILPFAIAANDRRVWGFSLAATAALVGFYLVYHPVMLLGPYAPTQWRTPLASVPLYLLGAVALWLIGVEWTLWLIGRVARSHGAEHCPSPRS